MRQIPLPLNSNSEANELIITDCNQDIFDHISDAGNQGRVQILLLGADHSGKNLFGRYFEQTCHGLFIPNADKLSDIETFFAWNKAHDEGRSLLMSARQEPSQWSIELPDLKSRIAAMQLLQISPPDDELICELIVQRLRAHDVAIAASALSYCQKRIERDYQSLYIFINDCIAVAKEQNSAVRIEDVKALLKINNQSLLF